MISFFQSKTGPRVAAEHLSLNWTDSRHGLVPPPSPTLTFVTRERSAKDTNNKCSEASSYWYYCQCLGQFSLFHLMLSYFPFFFLSLNHCTPSLYVPLFCGWCVSVESVGLRSKLLRKVEELKSDSVCLGIPDEFLCPITRELMKEPVIAAGELRSSIVCSIITLCFFVLFTQFFAPQTDGYSYEKEAIESWINTKNRSSPMTNLPLLTTLLTPNHTLKMAIGRWKTSQ